MNIINNKKRYIFIGILFIIMFIFLSIKVQAEKKDLLKNFPDSYKPYIDELSKKHPNWNFVPLYTNLDWNYVIEQENKFGANLVPKKYGDSWYYFGDCNDGAMKTGWYYDEKSSKWYYFNEEGIMQTDV